MTMRPVVIVHLTSDKEKLWSCENMWLRYPLDAIAKKDIPKELAGKPVVVDAIPVKPSPFCSAQYAWRSVEGPDAQGKEGTLLCEHQVDVD